MTGSMPPLPRRRPRVRRSSARAQASETETNIPDSRRPGTGRSDPWVAAPCNHLRGQRETARSPGGFSQDPRRTTANAEYCSLSNGKRPMSVIGSSAASASLPGHPGREALEAEINRYRRQLADCVNCPSSKTPAGKADIQDLSSKIRADKQQLRQMETTAQPAHRTSPVPRDPGPYSPTSAMAQATTVRGALVDAYA